MFKHILTAFFAVIFGQGRRHHGHGGGHCGALLAAAAILTGSTAHACCTGQKVVTHTATACTQAVRTTIVQPMQVVYQAIPTVVYRYMLVPVQPRFVTGVACNCNPTPTPAPIPGPAAQLRSFPVAPPEPPTAAPVQNDATVERLALLRQELQALEASLATTNTVQYQATQTEAVDLAAVEARKLTLLERFRAAREERRALKQEVVLVPAQQMVTTEAVTVRSRMRLRCL